MRLCVQLCDCAILWLALGVCNRAHPPWPPAHPFPCSPPIKIKIGEGGGGGSGGGWGWGWERTSRTEPMEVRAECVQRGGAGQINIVIITWPKHDRRHCECKRARVNLWSDELNIHAIHTPHTPNPRHTPHATHHSDSYVIVWLFHCSCVAVRLCGCVTEIEWLRLIWMCASTIDLLWFGCVIQHLRNSASLI